jgi:hypothetical protein
MVDLGFDVAVATFVSCCGALLSSLLSIYAIKAIIHLKGAGLRQYLAKVFSRQF